jgi:nucleoside-diphosphate-sugar epimerase
LIENVSEAVREYPDKRFTYIFTSGTWVYGSDRGVTVTESDAVNPTPMVAWRPALEQKVVQSKDFDGVVIRPGLVLGKAGSLFGMWFRAVESGEVTLFNDAGIRCAPVHTDDLAETYVAAVERIESTKGHIFNVVNSQTENVTDIIKAIARVANPSAKITYQQPADVFQEALGVNSPVFDNSKAVTVLGYKQKHSGVIDGIERYYKSWKAASSRE